MGVELGLLGEVTVRVDGRAVDVGPAKQRCVLAALAVDAPRLIPADRLVERVWGVDPPRRGRRTLYSHISRLRRALSDVDAVEVVSRAGGYALVVDRPHEVIDLHRFHDLRDRARADDVRAEESLAEALGLWRGPALTGLGGDWAEAERDRLEGERLAARHDLTDTRLRRGQGARLLADLAALTAEHPLDEQVACQYVLALHQAGRTADALEHYRLLRERLVEELGTDPGVALRDLHRRILDADPTLAGTPADPVPLHLPAAPGLFTGRAADLTALDHACSTGDVVAVGGTGGIGKTWLALTWAHRNLDRFPDGQLFVDLRGFSPGAPKDSTDVLADFLTALGVDRDRQPRDADARAALYRGRTAGKRMLVLLDNAATADQVVPLLPGGSACTVLITSRHRLPALLTRHGARPVHVDVLSDTEARALLETALGGVRSEPAVSELVVLCGGFPLALGVIAARVRDRPDLLDDVVAELRDLGLDALDFDDPDAGLPAVLSWSLRHLTDRQRTAFALLGIAPGPDIDLAAATNLTGLPELDTRTVLHALADASLITALPGRRYAMHDLVRAFAADHPLPEPTRRAALERVVDFYLHTAHTADRLVDPNTAQLRLDPPAPTAHPQPLPDHAAALAWLDAHRPHLLAAQRTAAAQHRHQVVWHLAWSLTAFHWRRGHPHDNLAMWQAAGDTHLPGLDTLAHRFLGYAHAELGGHEEAVEHLHRALALAEQRDDPVQRAAVHHALARVWGRRGDDRRALEHARHALELFRALDRPVQEADALNGVGWYAAHLGDHDTARSHCEAALALYRRHHDTDGEASALDSLGFTAHLTGRHREAVQHYDLALALYRALGNTTHTANTLDRLGHPHAALGDRTRARTAWLEALELYRSQSRDPEAARVLRHLDELDAPDVRTDA
ncbi:BTAD domain-containing putative transcriptional regulator [Umezawaea endophytica]|uniref:Tetratricopeptide repeat protein n=1 Tax=Umezawaea endophytica TaxID=1654476 RepID=A0A9X3A011_9PSEU|nr:BTAD domain-containing putative transcriptional regulator [Umezawaea endophytica]MCS7478049.1 tetratricopeptide repeat protein [Umezawaea endophytica]